MDAGTASGGGPSPAAKPPHLSPSPAGSFDHDHPVFAVILQGHLQLAAGWLTAASACRVDMDERAGQYFCVFLPEPVGRTSVNVAGKPCDPGAARPQLGISSPYTEGGWAAPGHGPQNPVLCSPLGPPKVNAVKKSEQATEGEEVVLVCKSASFPPVTNWVWYKISGAGDQVRARPAWGDTGLGFGALQGLPAPRSSPTTPRTRYSWCPWRRRQNCTSGTWT